MLIFASPPYSHKDVVILDRHGNGAGGYGIGDRTPAQVISAQCLIEGLRNARHR